MDTVNDLDLKTTEITKVIWTSALSCMTIYTFALALKQAKPEEQEKIFTEVCKQAEEHVSTLAHALIEKRVRDNLMTGVAAACELEVLEKAKANFRQEIRALFFEEKTNGN